ALREQQGLFLGLRQEDALGQLRRSALELMRLLHAFHPCLTGAVQSGLADRHSPIELHLFSDRCEDLLLFLEDAKLHPISSQRRYRYADGRTEPRPLFRLDNGEQQAELSCFPLAERHSGAPLDRLQQRPLRRLSLGAAEREFDLLGDSD
ncbi:MAG: hypothetical protein HQL47_11590, partial [Gammaproteobacteria bacterium]|nr:hypothetical protein [Gammaproteobacteria bacterium]